MSDFLTRVAARAIGQAALVRPRLPALFEQAEPVGGAGLEIVEAEVAATAPAARATAGSAVPDVPFAAASAGATAKAAVDPETPTSAGRPRRSADVRPGRPRPEPSRVDGADDVEPAVSTVSAQPARVGETVEVLETVAAVPAVPAGPAGPVAPVVSSAAPAAPAARDEAPPVRVHIGRLEVRASLHEAPQQRPRGARPRPQELALGDYLRGKRAAG